MAHCMPLLVRPRSAWILGAAIATIVWSMNVIATAKIMAVRIRPLPLAALRALQDAHCPLSLVLSFLLAGLLQPASLQPCGTPIISQTTAEWGPIKASAGVEEGEDGKDAAVVLVGGGQLELGQDTT